MARTSAIEWTDATFNPWWGCQRVSPACAHCYADTWAKRTGHELWDNGDYRFFPDHHWRVPVTLNAAAELARKPAFVFCASMADVFQPDPRLDGERDRLFELIGETPWLVWLLLTKRPEEIPNYLDEAPPNVWLGTSIENTRFTWRARVLVETPAPVHFLSCEPLLGSLFDKREQFIASGRNSVSLVDSTRPVPIRAPLDLSDIEWVIAGGESGPRHRKLNLDHARELRDACVKQGIPYFFKQIGGRTAKENGKKLDRREWCQRPDPQVPELTTLF